MCSESHCVGDALDMSQSSSWTSRPGGRVDAARFANRPPLQHQPIIPSLRRHLPFLTCDPSTRSSSNLLHPLPLRISVPHCLTAKNRSAHWHKVQYWWWSGWGARPKPSVGQRGLGFENFRRCLAVLTISRLSRWSIRYYNDTADAARAAAMDRTAAGAGWVSTTPRPTPAPRRGCWSGTRPRWPN
jgi:hypothetical protein